MQENELSKWTANSLGISRIKPQRSFRRKSLCSFISPHLSLSLSCKAKFGGKSSAKVITDPLLKPAGHKMLIAGDGTPLHAACEQRDVETVKLLTESDSGLSSRRDEHGRDAVIEMVANPKSGCDTPPPLYEVPVEEEIKNRTPLKKSTNIQAMEQRPSVESNIGVEATPTLMRAEEFMTAKTLVLTVYLAFVGVPFAMLANISSIFSEDKKSEFPIVFKVKDVILHPKLLPVSFYFILLLTVMFTVGVIMTMATLWPLNKRDWQIFSRGVMLFLVSCASLVYAVMVANSVPLFHISTTGSNQVVSSNGAVWIYTIVSIGIFYSFWILTLSLKRYAVDAGQITPQTIV